MIGIGLGMLFRKTEEMDTTLLGKLTYQEELFRKKIQYLNGVNQKYATGLCPNAEFLQKRMICHENKLLELRGSASLQALRFFKEKHYKSLKFNYVL